MSMMVSITCDGCGDYAEVSAAYDDACTTIDTDLDLGWTHSGGEDFCPKCGDPYDDPEPTDSGAAS